MRRAARGALQHEVSVHLLTCVNGAAQGCKFSSGLAGYEGLQEGSRVRECSVGGLRGSAALLARACSSSMR